MNCFYLSLSVSIYVYIWSSWNGSPRPGGSPHGIMVKMLDCSLNVKEFVLQSHSYIHFQTNTLGKGMNPLYPSSYGLNSITAVLLQGWLCHHEGWDVINIYIYIERERERESHSGNKGYFCPRIWSLFTVPPFPRKINCDGSFHLLTAAPRTFSLLESQCFSILWSVLSPWVH